MARTRKARDMRSAFEGKGFQEDNTHHHHVYFFYAGGKKTSIRTFISHGIKEYGRELLSLVRKQMKLSTNSELDDFLDCDMTEAQYRDKLLDDGHITI